MYYVSGIDTTKGDQHVINAMVKTGQIPAGNYSVRVITAGIEGEAELTPLVKPKQADKAIKNAVVPAVVVKEQK